MYRWFNYQPLPELSDIKMATLINAELQEKPLYTLNWMGRYACIQGEKKWLIATSSWFYFCAYSYIVHTEKLLLKFTVVSCDYGNKWCFLHPIFKGFNLDAA